jgi:peptidase YpeB-like protein
VATPSSDAGARRGLRDRPLGRIAILLAVLLIAFVASRSCASVGNRISQDEAVAIAKKQVDYVPEKVQVRLLKRGIQSRPFWAVSLSTVAPNGSLERVTVVVIDARSGRVDEIRTPL